MILQEIVTELSEALKPYILMDAAVTLAKLFWLWWSASVGVLYGAFVPLWELALVKDSFVSREILLVVNLYVSRCFDVTFVCVPTVAHGVFRLQ